MLCLEDLPFPDHGIDRPIDREQGDRAQAEPRKLVLRVATDEIVMEEDGALGKVDKNTPLTEEIEKFAADGERRREIYEQREYDTAKRMDLPDRVPGQVSEIDKGGGGDREAYGVEGDGQRLGGLGVFQVKSDLGDLGPTSFSPNRERRKW